MSCPKIRVHWCPFVVKRSGQDLRFVLRGDEVAWRLEPNDFVLIREITCPWGCRDPTQYYAVNLRTRMALACPWGVMFMLINESPGEC